MSSKQRKYFRGGPFAPPPTAAPSLLLEDESPARRQGFRLAGAALGLVTLGLCLGLLLAPGGPRELTKQVADLGRDNATLRGKLHQLEQALVSSESLPRGQLQPAQRARQGREGRRAVAALRQRGAQGAADLLRWFLVRWDELLDGPLRDDRVGRRAATLSLLVGGMAANLHEVDFVPWQAEFFAGQWLGELHYDIDGDGLPGPRAGPNTHDGFANVSVCHVAMALNQSVRDARVLMMPDMRCDRPEAHMSVFLQGNTFDDALNEFVRSVREQGFIAVERRDRGMRLILVGARPPAKRDAYDE